MKKTIAMLLAMALLICAFGGCAGQSAPDSQPASTDNSPTNSTQSQKPADDKIYQIDIADVYASEHVFAQAMDKMALELKEASGGRLKVTTFHNSTLGSEKEQVDAVAAGTLSMAIVGGGQLGAMYAPMLVFDAPFAISSNDHLQNVMASDLGVELSDGLAQATKVRLLGGLYAGQRFITTSGTAVNSPADLKGLKIRVPDQALSIANFEAFGASPTPMAFSEVYLALQQGVVNGQENPLTQIMSAKFYEVQDHISTTGHVTQCVFLIINDDFLNSLPEDLRTLLTETTARYCIEASNNSVQFEQDTLAQLETTYGMTVCDPDVSAFQALAADVIDEYSANWGEGLYEKVQALSK